jgi:Outer membrane protein beta-barrel domain
MKKLLRLLTTLCAAWLLVFALAPSHTLAQDGFTPNNRIMIQGGVNTPVGNFASLPSTLQDLIPQQNKSPLGAANLGFTLGLTDIFRFTPNFGLIISLDANYNAYNTVEAERQLRSGIANLSAGSVNLGIASTLLQTSVAYNAQAYLNGTAMGGLRYELPIIAGALSVYATAQGGLFYGVLPSTEAKLGFSVPFINIRADAVVTQSSAQAAAFAYGLGAGIVIADRINIGARYTAASPEFSTDIKPLITSSSISGNANVPGLGQLNLQTLIKFCAGYCSADGFALFFSGEYGAGYRWCDFVGLSV